jgi:cytochrome P450
MIRDIINSSLAEDKKSPQRLHTEVLGAIIAGTEGTANVLITATFYLLSNPKCRQKLQTELRKGWPRSGHPSLKQLLKFPYLVRYYLLTLNL